MKLPLRSFFVLAVLMFSGCGRIEDWADTTFSKGRMYQEERGLINDYLRSVKIYDQFTTIALFDVLWLSDDIRTLYANTYTKMHGRSEEVRQTFLRRQLKANSHFITFYVLSTHEIQLNLKPAQWIGYLKIGDMTYLPLETKSVELTPEYIHFFGKKLSKHKQPYEVRFERKDQEGKDILENATMIELYLSGPKHYGVATFNINEKTTQRGMGQDYEEDSDRL
jgi:hypothetical protein